MGGAPVSSRTLTVRYSKIAEIYTAECSFRPDANTVLRALLQTFINSPNRNCYMYTSNIDGHLCQTCVKKDEKKARRVKHGERDGLKNPYLASEGIIRTP